jgi:hypothetical protein
MQDIFQNYFKEIRDKHSTKDSTEHTLRTPFENLITSINENFKLIQHPKKVHELGVPDFKALRKSVKVGYIETKDLGKNLDVELETKQLRRYRESIENLILTDYSRFILVRNGEKTNLDINLFNISDLEKKNFNIPKQNIERFLELIQNFFDHEIKITSGKELAIALSRKAKLLKEFAIEQLKDDFDNKNNESIVYEFYEGIKGLVPSTDLESGADAYAQTITYGLLLAKIHSQDSFDRNTASLYIPQSVGVIKRIFHNISGDLIPNRILWIVDDIVDILNASDIDKILQDIGTIGAKKRTPFYYFYEEFLSQYDPIKKKKMGVFYTHRPIVSFIINNVNEILKKDFNKKIGYADDSVTVLDPAIGTGTFLWLIYLRALSDLKNAGLGGLIRSKIKNHLLKDFYGLELLVAPYIIAHLQLMSALKDWHYSFDRDDRVQVYLTNTLDPSSGSNLTSFIRGIGEENRIANEIKKKQILAIVGNPPYSGHSENKGDWINKLLKEGYTRIDGSKDDGYYKVDGKPLKEKNPKWLQDDYVKFIRFAQWKIDKTGKGIMGFITNNSYLNSPIHRGMRESLLRSFNRIYILNLHGDARTDRKSPDGSIDENVFDIKKGVAIVISVKTNENKSMAKVFYKDVYGIKKKKFAILDRLQNAIFRIDWKELRPKTPFYLFVPMESNLEKEYYNFWNIRNMFKESTIGLFSGRDNFVVSCEKNSLLQRIIGFVKGQISKETLEQQFGIKDKSKWEIDKVQKFLESLNNLEDYIVGILYRPFDNRYIFYHDLLIERSRRHFMENLLHKNNLALCIGRAGHVVGKQKWNLIFCSDKIIDLNLFYRGGSMIFPLYIYKNNQKYINIKDDLLSFLKKTYRKEPSPEQIFFYIYAVLHSNSYRENFEEFLKYDFPYIPFTKDFEKFKKLSEFGEKLVNLHLMKDTLGITVGFPEGETGIVEKISYIDKKVYINKKQYFSNIPKEAWNFYIGGYQVLYKWLKDRKSKKLSGKEIEHYMQIVEVINQTIKCMKKIDEIKFF